MRHFKRAVMIGLGIAFAAACGPGCTTTSSTSSLPEEDIASAGPPLVVEEPMLAAAETFRFDDIPVPAVLQYNRERSFAFENDEMRIAYLVYEGKAELAEVVQFMLEKLPGDGWQLGNVLERGDTTLMFTEKSRGEQLTVTVAQSGRNVALTSRGVTLEILLTPAGPNRLAAPRPAAR